MIVTRIIVGLALACACTAAALAAPPNEADVQGMYEGTW